MGLLAICLVSTLTATSIRAASFPDPQLDETVTSSKREQVVLAGGCFWGMEALFDRVKGVQSVVSGYSGGDKKTAHFDLVEGGRTGHAESVLITYNPSSISYGQILRVFFFVAHDPTQLNRQGPDTGPQYRSAIFYANDQQRKIAEAYIQQLDNAKLLSGHIVTEVSPLRGFYPAENFLQRYSERHPKDPYVKQNDAPKLQAFQDHFPDLIVAKE